MEWFEKIKARREELGISQAGLALEIGISQQAIDKIEKGKVGKSRSTPRLAKRLGIPIDELDPDLSVDTQEILLLGQKEGSGRKNVDLPLYGAAEGGPGILIVEKAPVAWIDRPETLRNVDDAYGVLVVGDSMVPEYRPGDELHIHPRMPIIPDAGYVFYTRNGDDDRATIKHLARITETEWIVEQHNPARSFPLSRIEWPVAHRIVGKKNRR